MCELSLLNQLPAQADEFHAEYQDCNQSNGECDFVLLSEDQGAQTGLYKIEGTGATGLPFLEEVDVPNQHRVNPTKVFWFVYKVLKDKLCPTCS